jgi:hypothetical protein
MHTVMHRAITSRASGVLRAGHAKLTTLVVAEHDNVRIKPATRNTVKAAMMLGNDVHLLVGTPCGKQHFREIPTPDFCKDFTTIASTG